VQLVDALYCTDVTKFLSAAVLSTTTMLRLELPTVSVLSKVDMLATYGSEQLPFALDYFTECHELERLVPFLSTTPNNAVHSAASDPTDNDVDDEALLLDNVAYQQARRKRRASPMAIKHDRLHRALAEVVDDYGLLNYVTLDISNAESVGRLLSKIDKCNGYIFTQSSSSATTSNSGRQPYQDLFQCAIQSEDVDRYEAMADIRERIASPDSIRELMKPNTLK
jgi:GPN-loop GTPase